MNVKRERVVLAEWKLEQAAKLLDEVATELPNVLPNGHHAVGATDAAKLATKRAHAVLLQTLKRIPM